MAVTLQAVVSLNARPFQSGLSGLRQMTTSATSAMMMAFQGVAGEIFMMTRAFGAIGGATVILKSIIGVGAQFEQQMASVSTVTGLVGDALDSVSSAAMNFAKTTTFTATQASDALYALGSAGVSTADGLINMLAPSLKLAGATQHDVKGTTEALTKTLSAFRLETDQTTRIANLFAGAVAASPANMERLSNALAYAAPVAAAFSMSAEQMVKELAAFHKVGLLGSKAGTSFSQAMMSLRDAMKKTDSVIGKALKGWDPSIEGVTGAIQRLEKAGIAGSQVMDEFGRRGGRAVSALLALGSKAIRELGDEITRLGDVERMYNVQAKTLSGQWDIFKSMINAVSIALYYELRPALLEIVFALQKGLGVAILAVSSVFGKFKKIIVDLAKTMKDWFKGLDPVVKGMFAMVGGAMALTLGLAALKTVSLAFFARFIIGALKAGAAFLSSFVMPVLAAMAVLTVALAAFSLGQVIRNVKVGSNTIAGHVDAMVEQLINDFMYLKDALPKYIRIGLMAIKQKILEFAPGIAKAFSNLLAPIVTMFGEWSENVARMINLDGIADKIKATTDRMSVSLQNFDSGVSLKNTADQMKQLAAELDVLKADKVAKLTAAFQQLGKEAPENLKNAIEPSEIMSKWMEQIGMNTEQVWKIIQKGGSGATKILDELTGSIEDVKDGTEDAEDSVDSLSTALNNIPQVGISVSLPDISPTRMRLWKELLPELNTLAGKVFNISISLPKLKPLEFGYWSTFFKDIKDLGKKAVSIAIALPTGISPNQLKEWSNFVTNLKPIADKSISVSVALPKMGGNELNNWLSFFEGLAGVGSVDLTGLAGGVDLSGVGAEVKETGLSSTLTSIDTSLKTLAAMEGVLWA